MAEVSNRGLAFGAASAALGVVLAFASSSEASHRKGYDDAVRCAGKVVRDVQLQNRSREGAVFTKVKSYPEGTLATAYGCLVRSGPVVRLGDPRLETTHDPALAGRFTGWRRELHGTPFTSAEGVAVTDLKTGRRVVEYDAMPNTLEPQGSHVQSLVVKRNGSIGWLGVLESGEQGVWKVDNSDTGAQRLGSGPPAIPILSFRISADRRTLHWLRDERGTEHTVADDTPRSAPID
jgi:hypothetical protein